MTGYFTTTPIKKYNYIQLYIQSKSLSLKLALTENFDSPLFQSKRHFCLVKLIEDQE